ncbi:MAG TPA: hypothetical protein VI282_13515 [Verrucomicrobiae bacterium]
MKVWASVLVFFLSAASISAAEKKLIEFGWDEPDTQFMREHIAEMEKTPFDGCVFHINMTWQGWGEKKFTEADVKSAIDDLKAIKSQKFTQNFLRFNTTPAKLDWFDDHTAVLANAKLAAVVAGEGKCPGLLFDIEQYDGNLFDYRKQRDRETKSWEVYSAQVRKRGREVMQAFQEGYPKLTIFLTFGYSLPWAESGEGKHALAEVHYGLLAPFLDGMLETAQDGVKFVDGCEIAYGYKEPAQFEKEYAAMKTGLLAIVRDEEKYHRHFSLGFGLWMDKDWRKVGWETNDFSKNFFTPQVFEGSMRKALDTADEYVWVYTESPKWWSKEGEPVKLPEAYREATRRARTSR